MQSFKAETLVLCVTVIVVSSLSEVTVLAQCELKKLVASNGITFQKYGSFVSSDGDFVTVGAAQGVVYAYRRINGTAFDEQILTPPVGGASLGAWFAVSGTRLLISSTELAYLFEFDGVSWQITDQLAPSESVLVWPRDKPHVAIDGDVLVLSALGADDACPTDPDCNSGAAYVFRWNGVDWVEEQKLVASDAAAGADFGRPMAIDGDRMVIAARYSDGAAGSAYVFAWNGVNWMEQQKLAASDGYVFAEFGTSVAIDGDAIVVGAIQFSGCPTGWTPCDPGAAYVFEWNGASWDETQILTASNGVDGDRFGQSVAVENDVILVGAPLNQAIAPLDTGAVFVFERDGNNWTEMDRLTASNAEPTDNFGWSVALTNGIGYFGAFGADGAAEASGAVYMFGVDGDCDENGQIDTCEILADPSLDLNGNLELDLCDLSIPTVSAWGVAAMTLLLLAAGSVIVRRKLSVISFQ